MKRTKIILFAYDFFPSELVASRRLTHWAMDLKKFISLYTLKVITCNPGAFNTEGLDELQIIPKVKSFQKLFNLIKLIRSLRRERDPSIIIISAGPFYFLLAALFISKKHKLIFDLRDPFVSDTNYKIPRWKLLLKESFQKWFVNKPDVIITINEFLAKDYQVPSQVPCLVIPNGFEHFSFSVPQKKNKKILVLGKVYGNLTSLVTNILAINKEIEFHQYTDIKNTPPYNQLTRTQRVFIHDLIPKEEIQKICSQFEIGLVSSYPQNYVLPVKTFDYLNGGLKLLIVNDRNSFETEIKSFLKRYPNTFHVSGNEINKSDFLKFLEAEFTPAERDFFEDRYFRDISTRNLALYLKKHLF